MRSRLPYLRDLGVDAVWINPWYPSPMVDGGYDVADYRDDRPDCSARSPTPTHSSTTATSIGHPRPPRHRPEPHVGPSIRGSRPRWRPARAARSARGTSSATARGADGDRPPTDWPSVFGGPAWTRVTEPDGRPGQWYLHLFAPEQPDLDWTDAGGRATSSSRSCGSGTSAASTASGSTSPTAS